MRVNGRRGLLALATCIVVLAGAGVAAAVSSGGYSPLQQDCSPGADAWNTAASTEPGCHNYKLNVEDGSGHRYAEFGIDQLAQDLNAHAGSYEVNTNDGGAGVSGTYDTNYQPIPPGGPSEFGLLFYPLEVAQCAVTTTMPADPASCVTFAPNLPTEAPTVTVSPQTGSPDGSTTGLLTNASIYLGADDNLDTGEHDGADGMTTTMTSNSQNGPSDGGAIVVNWHPTDVITWLADVMANPLALLTNPVPVADAGFGMCADGICTSTQTRQRTVYNGGSSGSRDVYNYDGKKWDPSECSSGSGKDELACVTPLQPNGMDGWRLSEAQNVYAEPGFQFYEDPDPQGSPIGPYPLPAVYAGTCGVAAGGGPMVPAAPAGTPVTNNSGQLLVSTGC
ncbi:MAG: hypothetical protein E6G17_10745 [Actinobacteria bacterium]|nr:MAG: hypothetical protein E6G17_10745 [Actinomycetota bacterium]